MIHLLNKNRLHNHFKELIKSDEDWYDDLFLYNKNIVITNNLYKRHYYLVLGYFINSRLNTKYKLDESNIYNKIAKYLQIYTIKDVYINCAIKHDLILKPEIRFYELDYAGNYFKCDYSEFLTYPDSIDNENIRDRYNFYNTLSKKLLYCLINTELNNYLLDKDKINWRITYEELNKENLKLILFSYNIGKYLDKN